MAFEKEIEGLTLGILERIPKKTDRELAEFRDRLDAQSEEERNANWERVREAVQDEIDARPQFPYDT